MNFQNPLVLLPLIVALFLSLSIQAVSANSSLNFPPLPEQSPLAVQKYEQLRKLRAEFENAALNYLEDTSDKTSSYIPPSKIDPRYTIALYVNTKGFGANAQRMWVLHRDSIGGPWRMALWDEKYWRRKGFKKGMTPPYSWKVSTGRHYRGDRKSGPTPNGVFSLDERRYRMAPGWSSPGMYYAMYIDYHYSSGRRSGVAFHGTTKGRYRRLGRIDSHGCVRMTQNNARRLYNRIRGGDGVLTQEMRWGDVPRFWQHEKRGRRYNYSRDGSYKYEAVPPTQMNKAKVGSMSRTTIAKVNTMAKKTMTDVSAPAKILTKNGYRVIAVMFQDIKQDN